MVGRSADSSADQDVVMLPDWRTYVGLEDQFKILLDWVNNGHFPSGMLLHGRKGVGKSALAAALVASTPCPHACGKCDHCLNLINGTNPDCLWLAGDEKLKIEDAEKIQDFVNYMPEMGAYRVVVVDNCERMTLQAANRLLKTIEEPPEKVRFIFITHALDSLIDTVKSRLVKWHVLPPKREIVREFALNTWQRMQGEALSEEKIENLLKVTGYAPGEIYRFCESGQFDYELYFHLIKPDGIRAMYKTIDALMANKESEASTDLNQIEIALNQFLMKGHQLPFKSHILLREKLRQMRRIAVKNKIAINRQLAFESIGVQGVSR